MIRMYVRTGFRPLDSGEDIPVFNLILSVKPEFATLTATRNRPGSRAGRRGAPIPRPP